jgi:hypothetical protein
VTHPGIDEHRRGRARFAVDEQTGEYVMQADRWHTASPTWTASRGCSGRCRGRTADDAAYWLAGATPAWRDAVQVVRIDLFTIYAAAVHRMLPHPTLTADLFHAAQLAVKAAGDVRRRVARARYGRRGRSGDPEYGIKGHHLDAEAPVRPRAPRRPDPRRPVGRHRPAAARPQLPYLVQLANRRTGQTIINRLRSRCDRPRFPGRRSRRKRAPGSVRESGGHCRAACGS